MKRTIYFAAAVFMSLAIAGPSIARPEHPITRKLYGTLKSGQKIYAYTLRNTHGMSVEIINYGGAVVSIKVPNRYGKIQDVALGFKNLSGYVNGTTYFGGLIGRYANRIGHGTFSIDGKTYHVSINERGNTLHGGKIGFNKRVWTAKIIRDAKVPTLQMDYTSPNGEEGFPGTVKVRVVYTLTNRNALKLSYRAVTDKPTIINLTSHIYFNLSGDPTSSILDEKLMINANSFTPTDSLQIATGQIWSVAGTPMDFRKPTVIGSRINDDYTQLKYAKGYDDNWVLDDYTGKVRLAATVYDPHSGRFLKVYTDQPGLQFYTGNYLNSSVIGKGGVHYRYRCALTLECQHFPYSPGKSFPSVVLRPGQVYRQTTIYQFSTKGGH